MGFYCTEMYSFSELVVSNFHVQLANRLFEEIFRQAHNKQVCEVSPVSIIAALAAYIIGKTT